MITAIILGVLLLCLGLKARDTAGPEYRSELRYYYDLD